MTEAAAALGAVGVLLAVLGRTRALVLGGLAAVGVAEILLARTLLDGGLGSTLASAAGAAAIAAGVPALAGLAAVFVRWPAAVPPVVVGVAPFRFPFEFGTENRFFVALADNGALGRLIPLYAVLAAAALALGWRAIRGAELRPLPPILAVPTALFVAFTVLSLLWAYDPAPAEDRLAFFVLPFAALLAIVARAPFRPWLPRVLALEAVALGGLFAAVGLGEAWARELIFYDPKVAVANEYTSYFRVTSLFSDPSIYGRHLAISIVVLVVALWLGRVAFLLGAAGVAFLWAGLYFSYSQSSMAALAAAVVVVTFFVADRRTKRWIAGAAVALVLVGAISLVTLLRDESAARVTSGRSTLVSDTLTVVGNHPVVGVGVAGQPAASRDEAGGSRRVRRNVSHTAPLTVAAELGIVGIALYTAFLAGSVWILWTLWRRDGALGLALLGIFVVLFVHSLSYGVFFDDPLLWAALGVGVVGLAAREAVPGAEPAPRARRSSEPAPAAG